MFWFNFYHSIIYFNEDNLNILNTLDDVSKNQIKSYKSNVDDTL